MTLTWKFNTLSLHHSQLPCLSSSPVHLTLEQLRASLTHSLGENISVQTDWWKYLDNCGIVRRYWWLVWGWLQWWLQARLATVSTDPGNFSPQFSHTEPLRTGRPMSNCVATSSVAARSLQRNNRQTSTPHIEERQVNNINITTDMLHNINHRAFMLSINIYT